MSNQHQNYMAWNRPGQGGQSGGGQDSSGGGSGGQNPWGRQPGQEPETDPWGRTARKKSELDLGALWQKFLRSLKGGSGRGSGSGGALKRSGSFVFAAAAAVLLGLYIFSGFYTVREAERGVVLRFGKVYDVVEPGLRWKFSGIDEVLTVDIEQVRAIQSSGTMLTEDENVVLVEMDVQYRITDPVSYLFSVTDPDNSLTEATDSALRYVVGHTLMDDVLTSGRELVRQNTRDLLVSIIEPYKMGLSVVDVNFLPARAPEQVKEAFDDAIAAQEDEQRYKREAEAYANEVLPRAEGQVQRILQEAEAYRSQVVLSAQGEVARFEQILPEYLAAPEITRTRIYLETMQQVLSSSRKVIMDTKQGQSPLMYLPLPTEAVTPKRSPQPPAGAAAAGGSQVSLPAAQTSSALPAREGNQAGQTQPQPQPLTRRDGRTYYGGTR